LALIKKQALDAAERGFFEDEDSELLPPLAGLSRLQRCHLRGLSPILWHGLPPGPWQRSLLWLSADWRVLTAFQGAEWLAGTPQLEALHLACSTSMLTCDLPRLGDRDLGSI